PLKIWRLSMPPFTKRAVDIFAPTDGSGAPRSVQNNDVQVWGGELERGFDDVESDVDAKLDAEAQAREQGLQAEAQAREAADAALSDRIDQVDAGVSVSYETRSQLYADLDHDDGAIGQVFGDSNEAY